MNRQPALREETFEAAADWLLKIQQGTLSAQEKQDFQQWLTHADDNRRAWQRVEKLMGQLGTLPPDIARQALDAPDNSERRTTVTRLALLLAAVPLAGSLWYVSREPTLFADHKTDVGERKTLQLEDGTTITLNTDTAIDLQYDHAGRKVLLHSGEIYLETGKQPDPRPFQVVTRFGHFRPLGTRFLLHLHTDSVQLTVQQGAVEAIRPQQQRLILQAGEQVQLGQATASNITPADEHANAWTTGMLLADAMPLEQFAGKIGRYRNGRLSVDATIANLAISGAYPLDNTDQTLAMLAEAYQLRIESHWFGYATRLTPSSP